MKVVLVNPGVYAEITELEHDLKSMQFAVGGLIQAVYPFSEKVALVCNDEGKLIGLPLNRCVENYNIIAGSFFICGIGEEDFCSLTDEQAERYLQKFRLPQKFVQTQHGVLMQAYDPQAEAIHQSTPPKKTKKRSEPTR